MNDIKEMNIENKIYEIRGKQVMLDSDLARLYNVETKYLNRQVKRNIERFDEDFMFQLTNDEYRNLKCQIGTSTSYGGRRTLPYVFSEMGVATLASILHSDIAINMSKRIIRAFVLMRHYIGTNEYRLSNMESKVIEHDNRIKLIEESFNKFEEKKKVNNIYYRGEIYDAYSAILNIFKEAKEKLIIIDNYADKSLLDIVRDLKVEVIIITRKNNLLKELDIDKYNKQYDNLKVIYNNTYHDRYFILDNEKVYHCGASINRIGYKTFSINLISDKEQYKTFLDKVNKLIENIL